MTKQDLIILYIATKNDYDTKVVRAANEPDTDVSLVITEAWIVFLDILYKACEQYLEPKFPGHWYVLANIYRDDPEDFVSLIELLLFV